MGEGGTGSLIEEKTDGNEGEDEGGEGGGSGLGTRLPLLGPLSRFGNKRVKFKVVCPQNGTAVLKGLTEAEGSHFADNPGRDATGQGRSQRCFEGYSCVLEARGEKAVGWLTRPTKPGV